jgi:uncharacterized protein (DUF1499 family)
MQVLKWIVIVVLGLGIALLLIGQLGFLKGKPPSRLGLTDGRLKPPSKTPNSVSSQADLYPDHVMLQYARIEPLRYSGDPVAARARVKAIVEDTPGSQVVKSEPLYLYATMRTRLMKYTDDIEFAIPDPAAGVIHVRSSSRLGAKDYGANRKRIEAIRARFDQASS